MTSVKINQCFCDSSPGCDVTALRCESMLLHLLSNTLDFCLEVEIKPIHSIFLSFGFNPPLSHRGPVEIKVKKQKAYQWSGRLTQSVYHRDKQADNCWVWCWRVKFSSEEEKQEVVWCTKCSFVRSLLGDFMNDCRSQRSKENKMLIKLKDKVEEGDF